MNDLLISGICTAGRFACGCVNVNVNVNVMVVAL